MSPGLAAESAVANARFSALRAAGRFSVRVTTPRESVTSTEIPPRVVGNGVGVGALSLFKTNIDSGLFRAIQDAAVEALTGDQEWLSERNDVYAHRRDIVLRALPKVGMSADTPKGTIYVWAKIPSAYASADFCNQLLDKTGVSITPGPAFGQQGEGYVRISLGQKTERIAEAMERLRNF